jgi:HlyD family secretion protein
VKRIALALAACGLGLAMLWWTWAPAARTSVVDQKTGYVTEPASIGVIRRTISAIGSLKARSTVDVSSQLSGQIARVNADFNDVVKQGQVLAELDRRGYEAHVSQAQAEAAMARETIAILSTRRDRAQRNLGESVAKRQVFAARVDKARAAAGVAALRRARVETLQRQGAGTASAVEDARAAYETADAGVREAEGDAAAHEQAIASLEVGVREVQAELVNADAALPLRDAALDLVRLDLERSAIRSPIDGVVVKRAVEPGQTVAVSLDAPVLFTIAGDLSKMEIHANIDETDVGEISPGQRAAFSVNAFPDRTFSAAVVKIRKSGQLVQGVVTYTVILETENPDGRLLPGMTSTVRIVIEEVGPVLTLPLAALRFAPEGESAAGGRIWVLAADGRIEPRALVFGPDDRQHIAVLEGKLLEGESVILARARPAETGRFFGIRF